MNADKKQIWMDGQLIEVTEAVYEAYMKGDRKIRYFERDLKTERFILDEDGHVRQVIPSREDSLDRLSEETRSNFRMSAKAWRNWCFAGSATSSSGRRSIYLPKKNAP